MKKPYTSLLSWTLALGVLNLTLLCAEAYAEGFWVCTDKNTKTTQYTYNPVATDDVTCVPMDNKRVTFSKMEEVDERERKDKASTKKAKSDKPKKKAEAKGKGAGKNKAAMKKKASSAAKKVSAKKDSSGGKKKSSGIGGSKKKKKK